MKNKLTQILAVVGGLIVVAGLFYYLAHTNSSGASSSGTLSRDEASSLILAYMKQNPDTLGVNNYGLECPASAIQNSQAAQKMLVSEGYLSANYMPTSKGTSYVFQSDQDGATLVVAEPQSIEVTGITATGQDTDQADFTAFQQLTPFGVACSYPTSESISVNLQLYDNGWRVVGYVSAI
jgi:hypothetical protein